MKSMDVIYPGYVNNFILSDILKIENKQNGVGNKFHRGCGLKLFSVTS